MAKSNLRHGEAYNGRRSKEFNAWCDMRARCNTPSSTSFKRYGAKGVRVAARWDNFENFLKDMGRAPSSAHSIDRINSRGHYTTKNCRWATLKQQARNKTNTHWVVVGRKKKSLAEWCEILGVNYKTAHARIKRGWPIPFALELIAGGIY